MLPLKKLKHRLSKKQQIKRLVRIERRAEMVRKPTFPHRHFIPKPNIDSGVLGLLLGALSFSKYNRHRRKTKGAHGTN